MQDFPGRNLDAARLSYVVGRWWRMLPSDRRGRPCRLFRHAENQCRKRRRPSLYRVGSMFARRFGRPWGGCLDVKKFQIHAAFPGAQRSKGWRGYSMTHSITADGVSNSPQPRVRRATRPRYRYHMRSRSHVIAAAGGFQGQPLRTEVPQASRRCRQAHRQIDRCAVADRCQFPQFAQRFERQLERGHTGGGEPMISV